MIKKSIFLFLNRLFRLLIIKDFVLKKVYIKTNRVITHFILYLNININILFNFFIKL